jgi:ATP-binding cassette subfamily C (CFTR/MRP) protein 1
MIKTEFKECTVITVAHRLNTIINYDRILVLKDGYVAEIDTPINLLNNK